MVSVGEGGSGARYAAAVCVMYWLLLSYPLTLALASVATLLITLLIYIRTLLRRRDTLARLTCRDTALCHYVTLHCHAFRRPLQLPLWCRNRHVQSCLAVCASQPGVTFRRQYLQLPDKGLVALDWEEGGQHLPHHRPLLLILPDLPQSAVSVGALCVEAFSYGVRAVVVNRRGQGGSVLHTPSLPAYGDASDLREVVDYLRQDGAPLSAVGVGTGGDLLLSYLGQFGSSAHLTSAVCVSPSYGGERSLHHLTFPYSCLYLSHLKSAVLAHAPLFGEAASAMARGSWTVQEFDRRLYCRGEGEGEGEGGYSSLEEFWAENEPLREADEISVPVLCVSSQDDPVCPSSAIPHDLFRALPNLFLLTLPRGGHAGFRPSLRGLSWADSAAMDFVLAMMTFQAPHHDVSEGRAHTSTQTDVDYFNFQYHVDGDDEEALVDECEDRQAEDEHLRTILCHSLNGHCPVWDVCSDTPWSDRDGQADRQIRSPTETHGLR